MPTGRESAPGDLRVRSEGLLAATVAVAGAQGSVAPGHASCVVRAMGRQHWHRWRRFGVYRAVGKLRQKRRESECLQ